MRTSTVRLLTGDYAERLNVLYAQAKEAEQQAEKERASARLMDQPAYMALREQYETLRAEAEREGITVTLRALPRPVFRALKADHPARTEGSDEDVRRDRLAGGINVDTVEDDLVHASVVTVAQGGELTTFREPDGAAVLSREKFDAWANGLSEGDWQTLVTRAWELTNVARIDPKSLAALPTQTGGASGA